MPWNLLLFPLLGGFIFLHICNLFRYRSQRYESERLLLQSAYYGVFCGIAGRLITFWVSKTPIGQRAQSFLHNLVSQNDAPYMGTAIAALLFGWTAAYAINVILWALLPNRSVKLFFVRRYDNGLLRMLYFAMYSGTPVSLTLLNRKVYIGYVFDPPGDSPHDRFLTLMLLLSGYRAEESMRFIETINYADRTILPGETEDEETQVFTITLPLDQIVTANEFDRDLYEQEFAEKLII